MRFGSEKRPSRNKNQTKTQTRCRSGRNRERGARLEAVMRNVTRLIQRRPRYKTPPVDGAVVTRFNSDNAENRKAHFYVFCPTCKALKTGKLRVRCHFCRSGAFTVHSDPQSWTDVLEPKRITGTCENGPELCANVKLLLACKILDLLVFYW